jgi:phage gp36-like protein
VDASVVDRAIADADAEIDSYCGSRHRSRLQRPGHDPQGLVDIAVITLRRRRGASQDRKDRYDAIRFLKAVADGSVSLAGIRSRPRRTTVPRLNRASGFSRGISCRDFDA